MSAKFLTYGSLAALVVFAIGAPESIKSQASIAAESNIASTNLSPNLKAFLTTIRYAEGTSGEKGYRTIYTGKQFESFASHPRQRQCAIVSGKSLCSDAAGAYQFLSSTWDGTAKRIGAKDFSPKNQDLGAVELIKNAGALSDIEAGKFEVAVGKVAPIWASLPDSQGKSVYAHTGQSARDIDGLKKVYLQAGGKD